MTTIVTQLTGEPGIDLEYNYFAVVESNKSLSEIKTRLSKLAIAEFDDEFEDSVQPEDMVAELQTILGFDYKVTLAKYCFTGQ